MRRWLFLILFVLGNVAFVGQANQYAPTLIRIGRGAVQSIEWHPDGGYVLVATVTGAWIYTPTLQDLAHIPDVRYATISPDGRYIAGTPDGQQIHLWDALTFEPVPLQDNHLRQIWSLMWSPDSQYIAVSGNLNEDFLWIFDVESSSYVGQFGRSYVAKWSPDGRYLATYDTTYKSLYVWDMDERKAILSEPYSGTPARIIWLGEVRLFVMTLGELAHGTLWNVTSGEKLFSNDICSAADVTFSLDTEFLFAGCIASVLIFRVEPFERTRHVEIDSWLVSSLALKPDGTLLAAGTSQSIKLGGGNITIMNSQTGEVLVTVEAHRSAVSKILWQPDENRLLSIGTNDEIAIFDAVKGQKVASQDAHTLSSEVMAWKDDETVIAVADTLENVNLWDTTTGELTNSFGGHHQPVTEIEWQPNGDFVATRGGEYWQSEDTTIRVWDAQNASNEALKHEFVHPEGSLPIAIDWHPDGQQIVSAGQNAKLYIWDLADPARNQQVQLLEGNALTDVRWSPDGTQIAAPFSSSGNGGAIFLFNVATSEFTFNNAFNYRTAWTWMPNNALIWMNWGRYASVGYAPAFIDPVIKIVGQPDYVQTLTGLTEQVVSGRISNTGQYAVAITQSRSGLVWDVISGDVLFMVSDVNQIDWSLDDTRIAIQRRDQSIWILNSDGQFLNRLPTTFHAVPPGGHHWTRSAIEWSPDGSMLAHLHDGIIDIWRLT